MKILGFEIKRSLSQKSERLQLSRMMNTSAVTILGHDGRQYVREGYSKNSNVYGAINLIINAAKKAEFLLFEATNPAKARFKYRPIVELKKVEFEEVDNHDILSLLERPNPLQGKSEFIENIIGWKKITGEAFIYKVRTENGLNAGKVMEMWVIPPPLISIVLNGDNTVKKYVVHAGGTTKDIEPEDMIHIKNFNPSDINPERGMSPIQAGARVVTQNNDTYMASMRLLQNGGPIGMLSKDGADGDLTPEQADAIKEKFREKYGGAGNIGEWLITSASLKWVNMGLNAVDLAILESQKSGLRDICNLLGPFSSQMLNDPENKTYSNMQEARKDFIGNCVIGELSGIVDQLNRHLLPHYEKPEKKDYVLKIDKSVFPELQEDIHTMAKTIGMLWQLTPNQALEMLGKEQSDDPLMDLHYLPSNLLPLGSESDLSKGFAS